MKPPAAVPTLRERTPNPIFRDVGASFHYSARFIDGSVLSRFAPRAGLVALRQTFVRCCHLGWTASEPAPFLEDRDTNGPCASAWSGPIHVMRDMERAPSKRALSPCDGHHEMSDSWCWQ
jgi:hypothetical protein